MSLDTLDIARLAASFPGRARVSDPAAREAAKRTKEDDKRKALAAARARAERYADYTDSQYARIEELLSVHWPRARAIANARSEVRAVIAQHFDRHDTRVELSQSELYDLIFREWRLSVLIGRVHARS